jgi:hypothetical protein
MAALGVPAPCTKGQLMLLRAVTRFAVPLLGCAALALAGCGSATAPDPVIQSETFTGTLQPLGSDFKTFSIAYTQGTSDLSVIISSLKNVSDGAPVTGITVGIGFGIVSGSTCSLQVQQAVAPLGQELFAPSGASAGSYCVQIYDCPTGTTGCSSMLTEPVTYSMTVNHY